MISKEDLVLTNMITVKARYSSKFNKLTKINDSFIMHCVPLYDGIYEDFDLDNHNTSDVELMRVFLSQQLNKQILGRLKRTDKIPY